LFLDEAQLLSIQVLDQLHLLLNFQKDSKAWLSIVLIGLTDLRETLKRNVLSSLAARMPVRVHIPPLDTDQVKAYIRHRMSVAGCRREVFAEDALLLMWKPRAASCAGSMCWPTSAWTRRAATSPIWSMPRSWKKRFVFARRLFCERPPHSDALSRCAALRLAAIGRFQCAMAY